MQRMRSILTKTIILMVSCLSLGCSQEGDQLFVVDNAFDVKTIPQTDWHQQTTYKVKIEYPMTAISKEVLKKTEHAGWIECADNSAKWESFVDESQKPSRIIHQKILKFAKKGEFVTVGMMYFSVLGDATATNLGPNNTTQNVYIVHDDLSKMPLEYKQQFQELYAGCINN